MNHQQLEATDPTFVQDITESQDYVWLAASWLSQMGHSVQIPPLRVRPDVKDRYEYSDDGDLILLQKIEVKHRLDIDFHSKQDFPYKTLIVDVCHKVDDMQRNGIPLPYAYLIFNASGTGCFKVSPRTFKAWRRVQKYDNRVNREREFYEIDMSMVTYHEVR